MALKLAKISYELREVLLKDKPEEMLAISPKGTVPVLQFNDKILDESLDIINWAFARNPSNFYTAKGDESKLTSEVIKLFDNDFKYHLDELRQISHVDTICMHGSPRSKFDNKDIWNKYNYRKLGIIGEPYYDVDFNNVFYLKITKIF